MCHPIWRKHYITIDPPNQDNKAQYYAIGSTAAAVNVLVLFIGVYLIHKLIEKKGIIEENTMLSDDKSCKVRLCKALFCGFTNKLLHYEKIFMIFLPILLQVVDSLLDALYFIKLKAGDRIIHVPPHVHILQAVLLLTCKSHSIQSYARLRPKNLLYN